MITLGKFQIPASICRMLAAIKLILQLTTTNVIEDKLPGINCCIDCSTKDGNDYSLTKVCI